MKKINYTKPNSLENFEKEFDNLHVDIAENIQKILNTRFVDEYEDCENVSQVFANEMNSNLSIVVFKKNESELVSIKYLVTIQKLID